MYRSTVPKNLDSVAIFGISPTLRRRFMHSHAFQEAESNWLVIGQLIDMQVHGDMWSFFSFCNDELSRWKAWLLFSGTFYTRSKKVLIFVTWFLKLLRLVCCVSVAPHLRFIASSVEFLLQWCMGCVFAGSSVLFACDPALFCVQCLGPKATHPATFSK